MNRKDINKELIGDLAGEFLDNHYTCSQAVFLALKSKFKELDKIDENIFAGFGGGFACTGNTCGSIVGATAVLSLYLIDKEDNNNRQELYRQLKIFYGDIEEKYGGLNCSEIIGIDFSCPKDASRFKNEKYEQVCKPLVSYVAEKVANTIKNNK